MFRHDLLIIETYITRIITVQAITYVSIPSRKTWNTSLLESWMSLE